VDARYRPTTPLQNLVSGDGSGEAQCICTLTRPIFENECRAANKHTIRAFGTMIVLLDKIDRLTKMMRC
jgi:hypothetical protein